MATPTYAEVLTQINTYIVANGNNEITANVLNPILQIMTNFTNNNIGNLDSLTTDEKNSIVEAINSLKLAFDNLNDTGVQRHTGYDDPNVTPPAAYNYADFYMQLDIDSLPVKLWQWNGFVWADESLEPTIESDNVVNNSDVPGITVTLALNYLLSNFSSLPKMYFVADGAANSFDTGVPAEVKAIFCNGALLNDLDWSQAGTIFTLTFTPANGDLIKPI